MDNITINYKSSVCTPAGWRGVEITALAKKISEKMAVVEKVLEISGKEPYYNMSRTGAKRQLFNGVGVAAREVGARKRLSACW